MQFRARLPRSRQAQGRALRHPTVIAFDLVPSWSQQVALDGLNLRALHVDNAQTERQLPRFVALKKAEVVVALAVELEVTLSTEMMRRAGLSPHVLSRGSASSGSG